VPAELPLLYRPRCADRAGVDQRAGKRRALFTAHGRLQLRAGADDKELFFSVSDEGPGIPEAERAKIFDMFYTAARGDRGGQGTGLGLAICQGMVGAHGGRISVADGIEGRGTCITLHSAIAGPARR
jgi:two-component system sensor histidine kinase KdpD